MYRVELKGNQAFQASGRSDKVPNVPCGVESLAWRPPYWDTNNVPNVPCGVERTLNPSAGKITVTAFLMYRVELKVLWYACRGLGFFLFLMYRVELKASSREGMCSFHLGFLMYRVELKEFSTNPTTKQCTNVPNVPCGVESGRTKRPFATADCS